MAFLELTKEEKPKLAVQVNNSLKYKDKDGNLQDRQKVTALIDIVREASSVAGMDKGAVMLSLNTENGFKNYFRFFKLRTKFTQKFTTNFLSVSLILSAKIAISLPTFSVVILA